MAGWAHILQICRNEPQHGITLIFGTQQIGIGRTGVLVREIKNIVMSELV